jgi:hypothetical protein
MMRLPPLAPQKLEEQMETQEVCEEDRDEIRRFAEFLKHKKISEQEQTEGDKCCVALNFNLAK